ncbi:MAG: tRNA lysidine(34) synthetase TilS [Eubacterium sp.]|nr:tRNA lysidine(34) synthetase TilS [Eubacterium sp.]
MDMMKKVLDFVNKNNILEHGDSVILGVSGGADSVCMLHLLNSLKEDLGIELTVVHVNHGIRGIEAEQDAEFVEHISEELGVECKIFHIDIPAIATQKKMSEEEAGRIERYAVFESVAEEIGANKIAVAHNLNDNSETVLFNLFRGSKLKGMTGIPVKREKIIRPLLCLTRKEIEEYLEKHHLDYCIDSTNKETEYSRNKLRLDILPYIKENINSKAEEHIVNTAQSLREIYDYIECQTDEAYENYVKNNIILNESKDLPSVILKEVVRRWIFNNTGSLKDITATHIDMVISLLHNSVSKKIEIPCSFIIKKGYQGIELGEREEPKKKIGQVLLEDNKINQVEYFSVSFEKSSINKENVPDLMYTKWFDYDKINKLLLRSRQPGDYIIIDKKGGKKKLKDYFIDEKVPREKRDEILLLADGSHIVWIVGYRISEYFKVSDETKNIIKIAYDKE